MISVIMLTFNRENYIEHIILDILNQTYTDFEYIIVDNGSSDLSGRIADSYAEKDHRIRVVHLDKPRSIGGGRNIGLDLAKGQSITFVDDDDRVKPDFLLFLAELLEENDADISICGIEEQHGETIVPQCVYNDKDILSGEDAVVELLKRRKIRTGLPGKLIKKKLFKKVRFDECCRAEDTRITYKLFAEASKVALHGIPLYLAIKHDNNNSAFTNDFNMLTYDVLEEYLETYRIRLTYLIEKFPDKSSYWHYIVWSFMISMCEKIERYHLKDCASLHAEMLKELKENERHMISSPFANEMELKIYRKILSNKEDV